MIPTFEPTKNQDPKNTKFTNQIFNDIDLMLPINTGKKPSIQDRNGSKRNYTIYSVEGMTRFFIEMLKLNARYVNRITRVWNN